jgi:hypothetical protein
MSEAAEQAKPPSLGDLVGVTAFVVGLISAWLYAAGWTYAYHYFDRFGIPLLMVDIPKENYFVYGGIVVRPFPFWGLGLGLAIPLGVIVVAAMFWLGHEAGVAAAHRQYSEQRRSDSSARRQAMARKLLRVELCELKEQVERAFREPGFILRD